jgi:glycosyltransferase involved in cell wall biosynthesis
MEELNFPSVTIGIVVTRKEKYERAVNSASLQVYPGDIDIHLLDNTEKKMSIGAAYNKLADECEGEWILYLGDDDEIVPGYVLSLMVYMLQMKENNPVCSTSHCTLYGEDYEERHCERIPTGMWKKSYVVENRFDETLDRYVDTEFFERTDRDGNVNILLASWQFGYFYQQHNNNISGNKIEIEGDVGAKIGGIIRGCVRDLR